MAVVAWIVLDELLPETDNRLLGVGRVVLGVIIATGIIYFGGVLVALRPHLYFRVELLDDPANRIGRHVESPLALPLVAGSAWILVYVDYVCRGPLAAIIGKGLAHGGHKLELDFEPPKGLLVNAEQANGADVKGLTRGRRGVSVSLPAPLPKGTFAAFQMELVPVTDPVPLPLAANVNFVRGPGPARARLALVKSHSNLKKVQVLP